MVFAKSPARSARALARSMTSNTSFWGGIKLSSAL